MNHKPFLMLWICLITLALVACTATPVAPTDLPVTPQPELTETAALPAPSDPPVVTARVLLISAGAPEEPAVAAALAPLAAESGLTVTALPTLTAADLDSGVRAVVWLRPDDTIQSLAAGAPGVAFVAITQRSLEPSANLSIIRLRADAQTFIGGMISTLIAPDWRGGALLPTDGPWAIRFQVPWSTAGAITAGAARPTTPRWFSSPSPLPCHPPVMRLPGRPRPMLCTSKTVWKSSIWRLRLSALSWLPPCPVSSYWLAVRRRWAASRPTGPSPSPGM